MSYFLIYGIEDGTQIKQFSNSEKLREYLEDRFSDEPIKFLDYVPENQQVLYGEEFIVIKGEVIKPKAIKIVKTYEIE